MHITGYFCFSLHIFYPGPAFMIIFLWEAQKPCTCCRQSAFIVVKMRGYPLNRHETQMLKNIRWVSLWIMASMDAHRSEEKTAKLLDDKITTHRPDGVEELTLPEKLCRFYVKRPKLAFGKILQIWRNICFPVFISIWKLTCIRSTWDYVINRCCEKFVK